MAEEDVRNQLMLELFRRLGRPDSWVGDEKRAEFELDRPGLIGRVAAERNSEYKLQGGQVLSHRSDVLVEYRRVEGSLLDAAAHQH